MPMAAKQQRGKPSLLEQLYLNGFTEELISVIPPEAPLTVGSRIQQGMLGKVPGRKMSDGTWCGGWTHADSITEAQRIDRWEGNIGLETSRLVPIDIDVNDVTLHAPLIALAKKQFGKNVPIRMGKRPLVILRASGKCNIGRTVVAFENGVVGLPSIHTSHKIETFHGSHKHFVIYGTHPSGVQYTCTPAIENLRYDDIPQATEQQVRQYLMDAQTLLQDRHGCRFLSTVDDNTTRLEGEEPPPQEDLAGTVPQVREALSRIDNTSGRNDWVDICHMVKGATQKDPDAGKVLWLAWCNTRTDGDPHLREADRVWDSAGKKSGGLWIGIDALLYTAGMYNEIAVREFANAPDSGVTEDLPGYDKPKRVMQIVPLISIPDKPYSWIMRDVLLDEPHIGVMWGAPGSNKSTVATAMAVHVALGMPFNGKRVKAGKVLMISEEDTISNRRRVAAWKHHLAGKGDMPEGWEAGLNNILTLNGSFGSASKAAVRALIAATREAIHAEPLRLIFMDTMARTFVADGDENDGASMNKYLTLMEELSEAFKCPVILIHHPPKAGETMRGHSSLRGAISVEMHIVREEADNTVRVYCNKMRDAVEFAPMAFTRTVVEYDTSPVFDTALPEEERKPRSALVLEATEWTDIVGPVPARKGSRGGSAVEEFSEQEKGKPGAPARVTELAVIDSFVLYPDESLNARASRLGMARQSLVERLKRMEDSALSPVARDTNGQWAITESGREYHENNHPNGALG